MKEKRHWGYYVISIILIIGIVSGGILTYHHYDERKTRVEETDRKFRESMAKNNEFLKERGILDENGNLVKNTTKEKSTTRKTTKKTTKKSATKTATEKNNKSKKSTKSEKKTEITTSKINSKTKKVKTKAELQKEYDTLNKTPPQLLNTCTYCKGLNYNSCSYCYSGKIINPKFDAELDEWSDKKEKLLIEIGWEKNNAEQQCLDDEIALKEKYNLSDTGNKSSKITNNNSNNIGSAYNYNTYGGSAYNYSNNRGSTTNKLEKKSKVMCTRCYGSGKCHTCNGKGWFRSNLTSDKIECPNCNRTGICAGCNGLGKR